MARLFHTWFAIVYTSAFQMPPHCCSPRPPQCGSENPHNLDEKAVTLYCSMDPLMAPPSSCLLSITKLKSSLLKIRKNMLLQYPTSPVMELQMLPFNKCGINFPLKNICNALSLELPFNADLIKNIDLLPQPALLARKQPRNLPGCNKAIKHGCRKVEHVTEPPPLFVGLCDYGMPLESRDSEGGFLFLCFMAAVPCHDNLPHYMQSCSLKVGCRHELVHIATVLGGFID